QILRFIILPRINTLNYYLLYLFLLKLLHIQYIITHITPFLLPFLISYYFNSYFLYSVKPTSTKFITFPITHILNLT
ncbi:GtrA family protein, partial [Staphylococcus aureus]|uniref:GtrA family protein n=1 Tax=Staphylococcus aureus TaxID=1280 RepID=UPI0016434599